MENLILPFAFFIAIYIITKHFLHKFFNLPPSPTLSLPIIGHLYLLKHPLYRSLAQIANRFGPILYLRFGSRHVLIVSSPFVIEECLTKHDITFANRPRLLAGKSSGYNYTSIVWAPYGDHWRNLRRISAVELLSAHRLQLLSNIRASEVKSLVRNLFGATLVHGKGDLVEMKSAFFELTMNNILRMLAGDHVSDTEEGRKYRERVEKGFRGGGNAANLGDYLPILRWFTRIDEKFEMLHEEDDRFVQGLIEERRRMTADSFSEEGKKATIDVLLSLQRNDPEYYTDEMIKGFILSLSSAGTATAAGTMEWALSLLLNNPEILNKAQAEIDKMVGHDHLLEESELDQLPYLHCIIKETLRMYPAGPLAVHESSEDCQLGGYHVPQGTMVVINLWATQNNPSVWEEPERFKPERFEGVEGNRVGFKMIPFGAGRRSCPGEGLANRILGLTLGALIQCFEWERVSDELIDMKEGGGISFAKAEALRVKCRPRQCMINVVSPI